MSNKEDCGGTVIEHDSNTNGPGARGKHLNGEAPVVGTLHCLPETSGERWAIVLERHGFENSKPGPKYSSCSCRTLMLCTTMLKSFPRPSFLDCTRAA